MIIKLPTKAFFCLVSVVYLVACSAPPVFQQQTISTVPSRSEQASSLSPYEIRIIQSIKYDRIAMRLTPVSIPDYEKKSIPIENVWDRARNNFQLDLNVDNRRTRVQRNWYARHQDYFDRVGKRAERYLFYVVDELEKRNMPGELALLPIVESAFDPFAYSHGRASGMWQFIPSTGKRYGLKQDWWYDGRRDVVAATDAALDFLQDLHKQFKGDWLHALAAYNSGAGNVRKAIRYNKKRGRPTDFWSLNLPKETKAYVPKLLALGQLLKDPEKYNLHYPKIANVSYFTQVDIGSQIDLAQAAELAEISLDELYLLNPGFNQWATSPKGPHRLNVPNYKAEIFRANLARLPKEKRISWIRYKIRNGDSLSNIAQKHGTTAQALKQINNMRSSRIHAGKILFIPVASEASHHYVLSSAERLKIKQKKGAKTGKAKTLHTVRKGESFWTISRKYNVGMRELARSNGMGTADRLKIGQKLVVWVATPMTTAQLSGNDRKVIRKIGYRVRSGDSLARIANKFNISISNIESWNGISRNKYLYPGQSLKLYVDVTRASL